MYDLVVYSFLDAYNPGRNDICIQIEFSLNHVHILCHNLSFHVLLRRTPFHNMIILYFNFCDVLHVSNAFLICIFRKSKLYLGILIISLIISVCMLACMYLLSVFVYACYVSIYLLVNILAWIIADQTTKRVKLINFFGERAQYMLVIGI